MDFENPKMRKMLGLITQVRIMKFQLDSKDPKDLIDIKAFEIGKEKKRKDAVEILNSIFEDI